MGILAFSGIPDGQASVFASCLNYINYLPISDMEELDNYWEHLDIVQSKKRLEVDLGGEE